MTTQKKCGILIIFLLLTLMNVISITAQSSTECDDTPNIGELCKFVTPPVFCAQNFYNITDFNGNMIENASLTVHNADLSLFSFEWTRVGQVAQFQVTTCDGHFREIYVGGGTVTPAVVTGQLFFLAFISIITLILLLVASMKEDAVLGFLGSAGLFIIGWALLDNPFRFLTGQATFIGLPVFGLGVIVIGIYFLLNSLNLMFKKGKKGIGDQD